MYEIMFLWVIGFIWILFASIQDLKSREVANWVNFSLIIFALGFRFFYCLFSETSFNFFYQGLIGLGIFFILGNLFYYSRIFAGGDAKLMIALGAILPFSGYFLINLRIFIVFLIVFLFIGSFYGLFWGFALSIKNFKNFTKEFSRQFKKNKLIIYLLSCLGICLVIFGFINPLLMAFGVLFFLLPYFYFYAKAIEEVCMIKEVRVNKLTEGDWLYKNIKVGKRLIKANWDGLSQKDIQLIKKKYKQIKIKQGIPFVPVFLISFLILIYLWFFVDFVFYLF
ncbi:MAG: prepilin peptidase [Nanoarchaeota archaeon]|nr:prepilin peptidase [Nanoarchaeota archaeon]